MEVSYLLDLNQLEKFRNSQNRRAFEDILNDVRQLIGIQRILLDLHHELSLGDALHCYN